MAKSHWPFWLVLLTEYKASTAMRRMRGLQLPGCRTIAEPLQQTVDASKFPTLVEQFTQHGLYASYCFER